MVQYYLEESRIVKEKLNVEGSAMVWLCLKFYVRNYFWPDIYSWDIP